MKGSSSEEEDIRKSNCKKISPVGIINEDIKGWTSSSKQQETPPEPTNTKEEIRLEYIKIKVKREALEWDDFVLQKTFKPLMYIDHSSTGYPKMDKLIDELKFKNCMRLKRKPTIDLFVGVILKKEGLLFILNILMPTISSHIHLFIISNIKQTFFSTYQEKLRYHFKIYILENSVEQQIHQIKFTTSNNGKTEYCGRMYAKNEVVL